MESLQMFLLVCLLKAIETAEQQYDIERGREFARSLPCSEVDPTAAVLEAHEFLGPIACALNFGLPKTDPIENRRQQAPLTPVQYVKVPLPYVPLRRISSLVFVAPPIIRTSAEVVTTPSPASHQEINHMAHPKYSFNYGVVDGYTGDSKSAWEERDGDSVKGEYSVVEADGWIRKVTYTADGHRGFNAVVTRIAPPKHPPAHPDIKTFIPLSANIYENRKRHRHHF